MLLHILPPVTDILENCYIVYFLPQAPAGSVQWIAVEFQEPVTLEEVHLTFQGGFVGKICQLHTITEQEDPSSYSKILDFFPKDDNSKQISFQYSVIYGYSLLFLQ